MKAAHQGIAQDQELCGLVVSSSAVGSWLCRVGGLHVAVSLGPLGPEDVIAGQGSAGCAGGDAVLSGYGMGASRAGVGGEAASGAMDISGSCLGVRGHTSAGATVDGMGAGGETHADSRADYSTGLG